MPTGYTADIEKGITFQEYALSCARQFGALVTMRDDPHDAEIPDVFEPSGYHTKAIVKAKAELVQLMNMSPEETEKQADAAFRKEEQSNADYRKKKATLRKKYEAMLVEAKAYVAPTPDHVNYRKFMIEQIEGSIDFDCSTSYDPKATRLTGEEWIASEIEKNSKSIGYHTKEHEKEVDRAVQRTGWVQEMKRSLGIPVGNLVAK
jgi:hypothetical protein